MSRREKVIGTVADALPVPHGRPVLIAIDGPDASGKTTLRRELAAIMRQRGRDVVEVGLDDFHHPAAHRYRQGRTSGRGFWEDSFDHQAFIAKVLDPLSLDGDRAVTLRHHDLASDALIEGVPSFTVGDSVTLLADGLFMQHPALAHYWDAVVWVEAPFSVRFDRMVERDGLKRDPEDPLQRRYFDGQLIYRSEVGPRERATVVLDNTDPARPRVLPRADGEEAPVTALGLERS
ncbi:uridine kinase [Demequina sp.]|uniref:uridine kinase n=1 Tax=Demequina sp. TaxID=2050685 RepID=UPI003A854054